MSSDFALCYHVKVKWNFLPILAQRREAGANGVRVLGAKAASDNPAFPTLFELDPRDPGIYGYADELFRILDGEGFNCEFVIGADEKIWRRPWQDQLAHFERMYDVAMRHPHVVIEAWNEHELNTYGLFASEFPQPSRVPCWSRGSGGGDAEPALPPGTHTTYHNDRGPEWPRKFKSNLELADRYDRACLSNEPQRCDGEEWPVNDWYEAGTCAALFAPGATFHSSQGRTSELWPASVMDRAVAFYAGMRDVSPDAYTGTYAVAIPQGQGLRNYDELRTYGMIRGGEQWAIVMRPGPQYPMHDGWIVPQTMNGWTVAEQWGPRGTVLRLVR